MQSPKNPEEQSSIRIDRTDRKIIAHLSSNGRMTITDLAYKVSLSVSRTQRRLRELETAGVIRGYRAEIDYAALGMGFEVILFATIRDLDRLADVDLALSEIPQIVEAQRLFGEPDYLLRVRVESLEAYQRLYDEELTKIPGLARMTSTIVMKRIVESRPTPLVV